VTNQTVLGQIACDPAENEITALPKLLQLLDLDGAVVTADAMHCQKDTARQIRKGGGDYLLQVKANQPALHESLQWLFDQGLTNDCRGVAYDYLERELCAFVPYRPGLAQGRHHAKGQHPTETKTRRMGSRLSAPPDHPKNMSMRLPWGIPSDQPRTTRRRKGAR